MKVEVGRVAPVAGGAAAPVVIYGVRFRLYMQDTITLVKYVKTQESAEAAAEALRAVGIEAEAKRSPSGVWRVEASIRRLASAEQELKRAVVKAVREAAEAGLVPEGRARRWLYALEGLEGARRPLYGIVLTKKKGIMIRYFTTNLNNLEREAQRLREVGLVEGLHFSVRRPEGGRAGYISILKEGLIYAAWLSARGRDERQRRLAAEFVERILKRAEERGSAAYERIRKMIEKGKSIGSLKLSEVKDVEVEVRGRRHVVTVLSWDLSWDGRGLRISILAEVDGVDSWYSVKFRRMRGRTVGRAYARASAPGGAEADAERFVAVVKALVGREPKVYAKGGKKLVISLGWAHLDGFARYEELAEAIMGWLAASWSGA
jgi:hypothetical protein